MQGVLAQWPWYQQLALLDKLPGMETRRWYAAKAIAHNRSRNILVMPIKTRLPERSAKAAAHFTASLPSIAQIERELAGSDTSTEDEPE